MKPRHVPIGTKYTRWLVIGEPTFIEQKQRRVSAVMCRCDCGKERLVRCNKLLSGSSKSCGCLSEDNRRNTIDMFWEQVTKTKTCWIFNGSPSGKYPRFRLNKRYEKVHRLSWLIHFGSIHSGLFVCHHCDTPRCVRPDHLFLGTHADNMKDMKDKGRHVSAPQFGESNPMAKLTSRAVREIRALLKKGHTNEEISKAFCVSQSNIRMIKNGQTWKMIL